MKNFKMSVLLGLLFATTVQKELQAIDLGMLGNDIAKGCRAYGSSLWKDTSTQIATVGTIGVSMYAYYYLLEQKFAVCLDGHLNAQIMHDAYLLPMTYAEFVNSLENNTSYAQVLKFIDQYCLWCYFFRNDAKINALQALVDDLIINNSKRNGIATVEENQLLKDFKNQISVIKENIESELINSAINADKNAKWAYTFQFVVNFIQAFLNKNN